MEHFEKKNRKEINERKVLFKTYLIKHDTTLKAIAAELGISMTSILKSIERGTFEWGPFAEWWKKNIEHHSQNAMENDSTIKKETPKIGGKYSNKSFYSNLEFHSRLKAIRKTLKLNQMNFAKLLGISQTFLSSIERGEKRFSALLFIPLKKLNVSLDWLVDGKGSMFNSGDENKISVSNSEIKTAIEILLELPEDRQKECINFIKDKKLLLELQKQVEKCTND
ncbi:helix-turn-helix domain-containing protein [bacterium]|nr:helix-turn-helix domain-containing protein [bacterium]